MENSNSIKNSNSPRDFASEYEVIFIKNGVEPMRTTQEWNKVGDSFKVFTLYKDYPTPILTSNTSATI